MNWLKSLVLALVALVLLALGILLGVDNSAMVSLRVLDYVSPEFPIMVWVISTLMLGLCVGFLLGRLRIK